MHRQSISLNIVLVFAVAAALSVSLATAGDAKPTAHSPAVNAVEVHFASATLAENPSMMKNLMKGLGSQEGVLAARFDDETKLLQVVFDPKAGSIESIEKVLGQELDDLDRKEMKDTVWQKKDCSGCPSASKCAKADK